MLYLSLGPVTANGVPLSAMLALDNGAPESAAETNPAMVARVPVAPGNSDLCFEWDGPIAGAVEHLRNHGVAIEAGPIARGGRRGRGTSVYFRDPDGSLLEFISYDGSALR